MLGVLVVFVVAGCGGGGASSSVAHNHAPKPGGPPEEIVSDPGRPPRPEPQRLARSCGPRQLVVSHEGGANGVMSTYHAVFSVFNLSERACSTAGFPKLFALRIDGRPIEGPAADGTSGYEASGGAINIAGRRSAAFQVNWSAGVYPPGRCGPRIVAGYRVVLPGTRLAQTVPYPNFEHCTGVAARGSLAVGVLEPSPELVTRHLVAPPLEEAKPDERLPGCDPSDLVVWQGMDYPGGVGLGTSYGHLEVANLSGRPCKLSGVPHMVAVELRGRPVGPPVGRRGSMPTADGSPPVRVARIGAHGSALFTFSVGEVLNYGAHGCDYEYAAGFDVTLPGSSRAQYVPAPVRRCLHSHGPQVSVGPIE
ncbi:MAG TPA: DUF4232 domain-containing protein [Solirubrobacterales bacterium]